jgi:hypothetical protein
MFQIDMALHLSTSSEAGAAVYRDGIDLMLRGLVRRRSSRDARWRASLGA